MPSALFGFHPIGHFSFLECPKFPWSHSLPRCYFPCLKFFLHSTLVYLGSTYGPQRNGASGKPSLTPRFCGEGRGPSIGSQRICLSCIIRVVSVKAGTLCLLLSAFYSLKLITRSEEHTSELQSPTNLVCRLLLEKKKKLSRKRVKNERHTSELSWRMK